MDEGGEGAGDGAYLDEDHRETTRIRKRKGDRM